MRKTTRFFSFVMAASCIAGVAFGQPVVNGADQDQIIRDSLSLSDYTIQDLELPDQAGHPFATFVRLDGREYTLIFNPSTLRSANFQAYVDDGHGLLPIEAPAPSTYRGFIDGAADSGAGGSLIDGQFMGQVVLGGPTAGIWGIEPLSRIIPGAAATAHVIYRGEDIVDTGNVCGVTHDEFQIGDEGDGDQFPRALLNCEIACDADFEFFAFKNGSDEQRTINSIEAIMNAVNVVYERDVNITYEITTIIIRTSEPDPYSATDPGVLLNQFTNYWNANHSNIHRDVAQLFTGKNIDGGVIGIAWLSVICSTSRGYNVIEAHFSRSNLTSRTALSAHELGHNFSARHCSGGTCHIMCAGLGGCGGLGLPNFGNSSISAISSYAAGRRCLEEVVNGVTPPFVDTFPSTTIDAFLWPTVNGAVINSNGLNEPSEPNSLNLDSADSITSNNILLLELLGTPVFASFSTQHRGVESGESLMVEFYNSVGDWVELTTIVSDGVDQTEFVAFETSSTIFYYHDEFQIRFIAQGNQADDDWYIDDVRIGPFAGAPLPFVEEFPTTSFDSHQWASAGGAVINSDGVGEPSEPYSADLNSTDSLESVNLLLLDHLGTTLYLSYNTEHRGVENGETLKVEFFNNVGDWETINTVTSDGVDQGSYEFFQHTLSIFAYHNDFKLRFTAQGNQADDHWFVDDIRVQDEFIDDCIADCDGDGSVNTLDFLCFLNAFNGGDPSSDCDGNGTINTLDFLCFLNEFAAGCP